jgi:SRSO17 transposase
MEPRFHIRLDELLADAEVPPGLLRGVLPRLETFLKPFVAELRFAEQRINAQHYVQGLLSDLESKDAESIAYLHNRERQGLQKFIGQAPWEHDPLLDVLTRAVAVELGEPDGVLVIDPSSFPKKGNESVGVQRQWCGRLGKEENCQVGVYLGYVSRIEHALVDFRLYLPKEWSNDRKRREKAGVPAEVCFQTRHELALDLLDERGPLLPHAWIAGDDEMGRCSWFRRALRERNECYLLAVPSNTLVQDLLGPEPPYCGRSRRPALPFMRVDRWCAGLPEEDWETVEVRDGEKGPLLAQMATTLVQARSEGRPSGVLERLVVFREQQSDGSWKHDYLLSNVVLGTPATEFARVFKAEHRIEECLKRAKSEAGLADYQVRTWEGWHHHQTLSLMATWFLILETRRGKNTDACADGAAATSAAGWVAQPHAEEQEPNTPSPHHESPFAAERGSEAVPLAWTQTLATAAL